MLAHHIYKPGPGKRRKSQVDFNNVKAYVLDNVKFLRPYVSTKQIMDAGKISCGKLLYLSENLITNNQFGIEHKSLAA